MEGVYEGSRFPPRTMVLPFIAELRRAGYDRKLRAGQSIWSLIVSRSAARDFAPSSLSFPFSSTRTAWKSTHAIRRKNASTTSPSR